MNLPPEVRESFSKLESTGKTFKRINNIVFTYDPTARNTGLFVVLPVRGA